MYEEFFGLSRTPFLMSADPRFVFLTPNHREAATGLIYAILKHKGLAVLTGGAGTGKTTVLKSILALMPAFSVRAAYIFVPTLTRAEFLDLVMLQLGINGANHISKARRLVSLDQYLVSASEQNKTVVLFIDEAHTLAPDVLDEIRLLTNFETREGKLLQIVLAGQNELNELLKQDQMCQLKQRIAYHFSLRPLTATEVGEYIAHRWSRAGATNAPPFDEEAIRNIALYSQGIPRLVNAICDNALVIAFAEGGASIRAAGIVEAARDLDLLGVEPEPAVYENDDLNGELADLKLIVSASTSQPPPAIPELDREQVDAAKQSWFVRSARKLLVSH